MLSLSLSAKLQLESSRDFHPADINGEISRFECGFESNTYIKYDSIE